MTPISFIKEFLLYLNARKKYWLFPVIAVILVLALLLVLEQNTVVMPFIYSIF